jgi:hypothetical protein
MGKISDDFINNLLDVAFGSAVSAFPATYHIGLSSTLPTNSGGNITEPVGNAYARVSIPNDDTNWGPAAARGTTNLLTVTFPTATPAGWGDMTHFVLMDAATNGAMVAWGALSATLTVGIGAIPTFDPGTLVITAPGT